MGLTTGDTDVYSPGGGVGGFGNGFGGFGLVGLIGLNSFLGQNGLGNGNSGITNLEQNVSDLRQQVADVGKEVHVLGNEVASMFATQNLAFQGEFRNLDDQICEVEKVALQTAHAQSILTMQTGQSIKDQMTAFQISNDKEFCAIKGQIAADGDATRALINGIEMQNLRDALDHERNGRRDREIEINIANTATATQNQFQQQQQAQTQFFATCLNSLGDQIAKQTNSMINLGTMTGNAQTATAAQTKVNS